MQQQAIPPRLAPFLAQWGYVTGVLNDRLAGLTDAEYQWEPAATVWTVRRVGGRGVPDAEIWPPTGDPAPPRTLAWSIGHLGAMGLQRADYLTGSHSLRAEDLDWPLAADAGVAFMNDGLSAWRRGLESMSDRDLDTVGRSAYPHGLDPTLPLIEIVWWLNKELVFHAGEIWYVRDLHAARGITS